MRSAKNLMVDVFRDDFLHEEESFSLHWDGVPTRVVKSFNGTYLLSDEYSLEDMDILPEDFWDGYDN